MIDSIGKSNSQIQQGVSNNKKITKEQYINSKNNDKDKDVLTAEEKNVISKLKIREKEVIAHEQAHKSVGGKFAGAMNYSYTNGPDGRRYISGGEVGISIPGGEPSEKLIQDLMQVKRAALAPAKPSGQDMSVASSADAKIQKVKSQLNKAYEQKKTVKSKFDILI